jgi:hypothetical protein
MSNPRTFQGLQTAVIVFAVLTVITSATTFHQFKNREDAELRAAAAQREAAQATTALREALEESAEVRRLVGLSTTDSLAQVRAAHEKAMSLYAVNVPEADRNLLSALAYNANAMQIVRREQVEDRQKLSELSDRLARLEAERAATLAAHREVAAAALADLAERTGKFADLQSKIYGEKALLNNMVTRLADALDTLKLDMQKAAAACQQRKRELELQRDEAVARLRRALEAELESPPDARITHVSQSERKVWLDAGRADGLRTLISFDVWDAEAAPGMAPAKGRIEIVRLVGERLAEARILEDQPANPLAPGDQISSRLWNRGETLRFAICGDVDLDGDGQSDLESLRSMIRLAGGTIDAQLQPNGSVSGSMTLDTRYLVVGNPFPRQERAHAEMQDQAREHGVEPIRVPELSARLGYGSLAKSTNQVAGRSRFPRRP